MVVGVLIIRFEDDGMDKVRLGRNEFGIKVGILGESGKDARFLVYSAAARTAETDNCLIDILLQSIDLQSLACFQEYETIPAEPAFQG